MFSYKKDLHIGNLIQQEMEKQGRTVAWLAKSIYCEKSNILQTFQARKHQHRPADAHLRGDGPRFFGRLLRAAAVIKRVAPWKSWICTTRT